MLCRKCKEDNKKTGFDVINTIHLDITRASTSAKLNENQYKCEKCGYYEDYDGR